MVFKKGQIAWNKGLKLPPISKNHKEIISKANKGKVMTEITKAKIRAFFKNKSYEKRYGKEKAKIIIEKLRVARLGKKMSLESTNKKKKYRSPLERNVRISNSLIGKPKSKEHIRKAIMNRIRTCKKRGYYFTNETKSLMKQKRAKQILPVKDTKIEVKIQNFLKLLKIEFFTHQYIKDIEHGYQCDILIPSMNMVIECDGDYWHKYPVGRDIDHIRTKELLEKGFKVLRLWEIDIKSMDIEQFKAKIK